MAQNTKKTNKVELKIENDLIQKKKLFWYKNKKESKTELFTNIDTLFY